MGASKFNGDVLVYFTLQPEISMTYILLTSAKGIWRVVTQTYSNGGVVAWLYELKWQIISTMQGSKSFTWYCNTLDLYRDVEMGPAVDMKKVKKYERGETDFCLAG